MSKSSDAIEESINKCIVIADILAERNVAYTEQFVTRAQAELYEILSGIMALSLQVQSSNACEKIIKKMRDTLRSDFSLKTQKNSKISSIVVKYVTRSSTKTAHVWGRVIQSAIDAGITADNLAEYIKDNGGIEKLRQKGVDAATKAEDVKFNKIKEHAITSLLTHLKPSLATIQSTDGNSIELNPASDVKFTYLMCTNGKIGEGLKIVAMLYPCAEIERKALDLYYRCCQAASLGDQRKKQDEYCKENMLNMDMLHIFMNSNGIKNATNAHKLLLPIRSALDNDGKLSHPEMLKLADELRSVT